MSRECLRCGDPLTGDNWPPHRERKNEPLCAACYSKYQSDYNQRNLDKRDTLDRKRRARKAAATCPDHEECRPILRHVVWMNSQGRCGICGDAITGPWHIDHIIPLVRNGLECYDNLQASHPFCNLSKGDSI